MKWGLWAAGVAGVLRILGRAADGSQSAGKLMVCGKLRHGLEPSRSYVWTSLHLTALARDKSEGPPSALLAGVTKKEFTDDIRTCSRLDA